MSSFLISFTSPSRRYLLFSNRYLSYFTSHLCIGLLSLWDAKTYCSFSLLHLQLIFISNLNFYLFCLSFFNDWEYFRFTPYMCTTFLFSFHIFVISILFLILWKTPMFYTLYVYTFLLPFGSLFLIIRKYALFYTISV